ncbi:MAG: VanZ family protein [Pontiellaceae bacterium]|nr:VanZ family protein [Pontiellaceae bacterium]MBN2783974.1 VanZ family protein [Pontiellaceae bacterium]
MKMRLPAGILLAATLLFWGLYDRYERAGPILVERPAIADASSVRGDCSETNGLYTLAVHEDGKSANVRFRINDVSQFSFIRVQGRLRTDGVVVGKNPWRCARLVLIQYDSGKHWIPGYHSLIAQEGTQGWKFYEHVFEVDPNAVYADLALQQLGTAGAARFDSVFVEPVRFKKSYPVWRVVFAALWIAMGILYFRRCRLDRRRLRVLILLNAIAIIFGTMMPERWIEDSSTFAREEVVKALQPPPQNPASQKPLPEKVVEAKSPSVQKKPVKPKEDERMERFNKLLEGVHGAGHFVLFASLCFLVYLSGALERRRNMYFGKVAFDILLFAAVTESLQHLTNDRTPGVSDWLKDMYGMICALILFIPLHWVLKRRLSGAEKSDF